LDLQRLMRLLLPHPLCYPSIFSGVSAASLMNKLNEFHVARSGSDARKMQEEQRQKDNLRLYINLKLASSGQPAVRGQESDEFMDVAHDLLMAYRAKNWLLSNYLSPPDRRIQDFLDRYLAGVETIPQLPGQSFILDHEGLARELSLPVDADVFRSDIVSSYRVRQGVLHNPASDRRTTRACFMSPRAACRFPATRRRCRARCSPACLVSPSSRRRNC
jgi:hypothetical protein